MFAPYTPIDKCVGREVRVRIAGEEYVGFLTGVYTLGDLPILVITPMNGRGMEQHIPLQGAVVTIRADQ